MSILWVMQYWKELVIIKHEHLIEWICYGLCKFQKELWHCLIHRLLQVHGQRGREESLARTLHVLYMYKLCPHTHSICVTVLVVSPLASLMAGTVCKFWETAFSHISIIFLRNVLSIHRNSVGEVCICACSIVRLSSLSSLQPHIHESLRTRQLVIHVFYMYMYMYSTCTCTCIT